MNNRKIVRELSKLLKVDERDIPKTLKRIKDEVKEMESKIK